MISTQNAPPNNLTFFKSSLIKCKIPNAKPGLSIQQIKYSTYWSKAIWIRHKPISFFSFRLSKLGNVFLKPIFSLNQWLSSRVGGPSWKMLYGLEKTKKKRLWIVPTHFQRSRSLRKCRLKKETYSKIRILRTTLLMSQILIYCESLSQEKPNIFNLLTQHEIFARDSKKWTYWIHYFLFC